MPKDLYWPRPPCVLLLGKRLVVSQHLRGDPLAGANRYSFSIRLPTPSSCLAWRRVATHIQALVVAGALDSALEHFTTQVGPSLEPPGGAEFLAIYANHTVYANLATTPKPHGSHVVPAGGSLFQRSGGNSGDVIVAGSVVALNGYNLSSGSHIVVVKQTGPRQRQFWHLMGAATSVVIATPSCGSFGPVSTNVSALTANGTVISPAVPHNLVGGPGVQFSLAAQPSDSRLPDSFLIDWACQ